jgi:hypothetical protein
VRFGFFPLTLLAQSPLAFLAMSPGAPRNVANIQILHVLVNGTKAMELDLCQLFCAEQRASDQSLKWLSSKMAEFEKRLAIFCKIKKPCFEVLDDCSIVCCAANTVFSVVYKNPYLADEQPRGVTPVPGQAATFSLHLRQVGGSTETAKALRASQSKKWQVR